MKTLPIALGLLLALILLAVPIYAAVQLTPEGCEALATFVQGAAQARDLDASKAKYLAMVEKNASGATEEMRRMLKNEVEKVWASKADPEALYENTISRCHKARGRVGEES